MKITNWQLPYILYNFHYRQVAATVTINHIEIECSGKLQVALILNVRGPSYLGLSRSISRLLIPGDISSHDIDYVA